MAGREDSRRIIRDCQAIEVRVGKGRSYWWLIPRFGPGDDVPGLGCFGLKKV
jgi:hypothetical protein